MKRPSGTPPGVDADLEQRRLDRVVDLEDPRGDGVQRGVGPLARLARSARDDDELRLLGGGLRAEDGGGDEPGAALRDALGDRLRRARPRRRHVHEDVALLQPREDAVRPVEDGVERHLVGDAGHDDVAPLGALPGGARHAHPLGRERLRPLRRAVPDGEAEPGLADVVGHRGAHGPEA
jgi:hypothetical protein